MIPFICKLIFFFAKTLNKPLKDYAVVVVYINTMKTFYLNFDFNQGFKQFGWT